MTRQDSTNPNPKIPNPHRVMATEDLGEAADHSVETEAVPGLSRGEWGLPGLAKSPMNMRPKP